MRTPEQILRDARTIAVVGASPHAHRTSNGVMRYLQRVGYRCIPVNPNTDEVLGKPEQAREKIVEGMLNKRFFAAQVLNEQPWIHDTTKTVGQALADEGAEVLEFERFALAG